MGNVPAAENFISIVAFIGITLLGLGLLGQPDQSKPRCAKCRTDARPFARTEALRCACGAALDRPGGVRTRGRVRRRRMMWLGGAIWMLAAALAIETVRHRALGRSWLHHVPIRLIAPRADAGDDWAIQHLRERATDPDLTPDDAGTLLRQRGLLPPGDVSYRLLQTWATTHPDADELLPMLSRFEAKNVRWEGDDLVCELEPGEPQIDHWLVRIERITIGARELAWSIRPVRSARFRSAGARAFVGSVTLRIAIPLAARTGAAVAVQLDLLIVQSRGAAGMARDERVNGGAPPETWPVKAVTAPVSIDVSLPAPPKVAAP